MSHNHYLIKHVSEPSQIAPEIVYTGVVTDYPNWFSMSHQHEFCELLYVAEGEGKAVVNGIHYTLSAGNLMILNPGVWHEEESNPDNPLELIFLAVKGFQVSALPPGCLLPENANAVLSCGEYRGKLDVYFRHLIQESSNQAEYYQVFTRNLAGAIVVLIIRMLGVGLEAKTTLSEECARIKEYLDVNYTLPLTLEQISEHASISKHYVSHLFKEQTGFSPIKYMTIKRINYASDLLSKTDMPISEIANSVGYDNPLYFSQVFKKMKGVSPREYRVNLTHSGEA